MSKEPDKKTVRFSMMKGDPPPKPRASGSTSKQPPSKPPPAYESKTKPKDKAESSKKAESKGKAEPSRKAEPRKDSKPTSAPPSYKSKASAAPDYKKTPGKEYDPWEAAKAAAHKSGSKVEAESSKGSKYSHTSSRQSVEASSSRQDSRRSHSSHQSSAVASSMRSPTKSFRDCSITMAVDVSASTRGVRSIDMSLFQLGDLPYVDGPGDKIIYVEQQVVSTIHTELSDKAKQTMRIVPWSTYVQPILHAEDVGRLWPGGGTSPSNLCEDSASISALQKSSLWFLMTDGGIFEDEVHRFANAFSNVQLHGTACVVVIYDMRPPKPSHVNISVGYTVFAVAPHCLLLFHDMAQHELYILRAKGCFESLLSGCEIRSSRGMSQRQSTSGTADNPTWEELTRINYRDLVNLQIPDPHRLSRDEIALSDGSSVRINDVLRNKISDRASSRILSNKQDLASVLSTASSRGLDREAEGWLAHQRQSATKSGNRDSERNAQAGQSLLKNTRSEGHSSFNSLGGSSRRG